MRVAALHARNDSAAARCGSAAERDLGQPVAKLVRPPSFIAATRLESARRECIANVSHELRTPLTVLLGFIETVRNVRLDPKSSRDCFDLMEEQCKRMQRTIEDLLQLSTLEAAKPPADERIDVRVLVARIRTDAEGLSAGRHRIVLDVEDGFDLLGVERAIASALGHLAGNAIRYTPPGGVVRLVWRASPKGAAFSAEYPAIAIANPHIPRLTHRSYRVTRDHCR